MGFDSRPAAQVGRCNLVGLLREGGDDGAGGSDARAERAPEEASAVHSRTNGSACLGEFAGVPRLEDSPSTSDGDASCHLFTTLTEVFATGGRSLRASSTCRHWLIASGQSY